MSNQMNADPLFCALFFVIMSSDLIVCNFLGMNEALEHLDRLNEYNFHIPEDLAIRHLTKINDAFGDS